MIGVGDQQRSRRGQPRAKSGRAVGAVGMFEGEDEVAAGLVIAEHRAGTIEDRRLTLQAPQSAPSPRSNSKGIAATGAAGRAEQIQARPTIRRKGRPGIDDRAAFQATRRQNRIQHRPKPRRSQRLAVTGIAGLASGSVNGPGGDLSIAAGARTGILRAMSSSFSQGTVPDRPSSSTAAGAPASRPGGVGNGRSRFPVCRDRRPAARPAG